MIRIEEGNASHIDSVMEVMSDAFDPVFGEGWTKSQLLSTLTMPNTRLILACNKTQIVAFALTRTVVDETELLMIGVFKASQRKAIASQLLQEVLLFEAKEERSRVFLEVRAQNHAKNLYEKMGFLEVGRRINYYRGADNRQYDAITMSYNLTNDTAIIP